MSKILAGGPFIGDFYQEVLTFRPYIKWIQMNGNYDQTFISSHSNRRFLYQDVINKRFISVYKQLSRHEINQFGYSHKNIDQKDYISLTKSFRDKVAETSNVPKKDVEVMSLPYVKYISPISVYHKIYEPISVPISPTKGNVVFIPDSSLSEEDAVYIYQHLCQNYDVSVIGDMSCGLMDYNEILQDVEYFQTGYQKIITAITNARAVITPCSHWTSITNLQQTPVLSWGDTVGPYRFDGIYHFGNKDCKTIYHDGDSRLSDLIKQIDLFLEK